MKKLSIKNIGKDNDGIKTLKITVDDMESVDIPIPILMLIINQIEGNEGSFYNIYKESKIEEDIVRNNQE